LRPSQWNHLGLYEYIIIVKFITYSIKIKGTSRKLFTLEIQIFIALEYQGIAQKVHSLYLISNFIFNTPALILIFSSSLTNSLYLQGSLPPE
jgi:hypothetical protein